MLMLSTWPKVGHRLSVSCTPLHLCYVFGYDFKVVSKNIILVIKQGVCKFLLVSHSSSIVSCNYGHTCIVYKRKQDSGRKCWFLSYSLPHNNAEGKSGCEYLLHFATVNKRLKVRHCTENDGKAKQHELEISKIFNQQHAMQSSLSQR